MSEAHEAEAPLIETPLEAPESAPQADAALSVEDRALTMGWTPKDQFKGDPERWVDAETYVRRGEEYLPFVKANNKRLERELEKANTKMATLEQAVSRSIEHISKAEQRAYERARRDLEADLDRAAEAGDAEGVRAVTKEIVDLEKDIAKPVKEDGPHPDAAKARATFEAANPWFNADPVMRAAAIAIAGQLANDGVIEPTEQLAEVSKRIRTEFPHKFTNPRREQPAAVEGASAAGGRRAANSYADLPADARQMCDELVRDKIITREKYVAGYFADAKK